MSSITTELNDLLDTVWRPGDFYATGTTELLAPHLEVEGVGPIALPLLPAQAEQLIAVAEPAPYGRGEDTLVDTEVRRTWQINADRVRVEGRHWTRTLEAILKKAVAGLGVTGTVGAEFYKLLVYDQGSFFIRHRDTEKTPGMFATLIIVLPSLYRGGELRVQHRDREVRLDLSCPDPSEVAFAAFYADCVHEILPITSGYRLTLVYNLVRQETDWVPKPPDYDEEKARVAALLRSWATGPETPDDDSPIKLIYPLEYAYTPAEIAFDTLKGADAAVAKVLVPAAEQADCELYLALLSIEESGGAEYCGGYGSRWDEVDEGDENFEVLEVDDRSATLSEWRRPDGSQPDLGDFPAEDEELVPSDALADLEPDEQNFHEATGNEGASFDRLYHSAALVLWPRRRRLAVFNQAGLDATLPYLGELVDRWADSGAGQDSSLWQEAHELTGYMLHSWPERGLGYSRSNESPSAAADMLTLLSELRDTVRIDEFLAGVSAAGVYGKRDNEALLQAAGLLPPARAAERIEQIIANSAATNLSACGDLLACSAVAWPTGHPADLTRAATVLVEALPGDPARVSEAERWRRPSMEAGFIVDLLTGLGSIDPALADRAADYLLTWPQTYGLDAILVPAVRVLTERAASRDWTAVQRLRAACLEHLRTRIAEPLEPPRDWARASTLACHCADCQQLSRFLADPGQRKWTFKAPEARRNHVQESSRRNVCDLDFTTERGGRPYSLIGTKSQASYDRRAKQRQQDLDNVAQLETPPSP